MGLLTPILDLFFPPRCVFCRGFLQKGQRNICPPCMETLPFCEGEEACVEGEDFSVCVSPFYYVDTVRESHHRYKFQGASFYAKAYAPFVARCVTEHCAGQFDLISWVPLSRRRLRKRGYDQAKLLAQGTAKALGIEAAATLKKVKNTAAQSGIGGKDARQTNISGAYQVPDRARVAGQRILLIDDIATTGATLSECARALHAAGAKEVLCATLARAEEKGIAGDS